MSASDREEIFRSSNDGLRETLQNQLAAHRDINQRAIDLVKIDLLAASIAASALSLSSVSVVVPYLSASVVCFVYSIWASVRVFRPRHFSRGLRPEETNRIQRNAHEGMPPDAHHEQLTMTYREAVSDNSDAYLVEATQFENAVWGSVAAVLFASVAALAVQTRAPTVLAPAAYLCVPVVCFLGKEQYGYDRKVQT